MLRDALHPDVHVAERLLVRHVKRNDDALGLLVERLRQCSEALLPGSVPNFDLHLLVPALRLVDLVDEVETQGRHVRWLEILFRVHLDDRGLADRTVSKQDQVNLVRSTGHIN